MSSAGDNPSRAIGPRWLPIAAIAMALLWIGAVYWNLALSSPGPISAIQCYGIGPRELGGWSATVGPILTVALLSGTHAYIVGRFTGTPLYNAILVTVPAAAAIAGIIGVFFAVLAIAGRIDAGAAPFETISAIVTAAWIVAVPLLSILGWALAYRPDPRRSARNKAVRHLVSVIAVAITFALVTILLFTLGCR